MEHYKYERLSAQGNDFLRWETPNLPMHGGSAQIFDAGPLGTEDGGVDVAAIKRGIEGILHKIPRYRQKLAWIPGGKHAVWVDDRHFNLDYHIRHSSLPCPGDDDGLKQLVARILERPLDRSRPLWEFWVVEGLHGGRFATIGKVHHCMVDGLGGTGLAQNLLSTSPNGGPAVPHRFVPRPVPSASELRWDERMRLIGTPVRALGELWGFSRTHSNLPREIARRTRAVGQLARWKLVPASDSPLNGPVGPHRVSDWLAMSRADVMALCEVLNCTVDDVVLGVVTGALREFMIHRQVHPEELDFRVASPARRRSAPHEDRAGEPMASWLLRLPLGEANPLNQVAEIRRSTQERERSHHGAAIETVEAINEWFPIDLQSWSRNTQNTFVVNVPGPQVPLHLLGAELLELYILPPLIENLGLTLGVISYNGRISWGFHADYDRVPDIDDLVAMVKGSFERLAKAAGVKLAGLPAAGARLEALAGEQASTG